MLVCIEAAEKSLRHVAGRSHRNHGKPLEPAGSIAFVMREFAAGSADIWTGMMAPRLVGSPGRRFSSAGRAHHS